MMTENEEIPITCCRNKLIQQLIHEYVTENYKLIVLCLNATKLEYEISWKLDTKNRYSI